MGKELAANSAGYTHDAMEKLADALVDKLFSRVTSLGAPLGMAAPSTMAARPFLSSRQYFAAPQTGYQPQLSGTTTSVQAAKDNLKAFGVGSSPLENLALTAIDVANRRDVSAKAKASLWVSSIIRSLVVTLTYHHTWLSSRRHSKSSGLQSWQQLPSLRSSQSKHSKILMKEDCL